MSWAGAVSAVFVLDSKGKQLIGRDFRGDTPAGCVERFVNIVTGETGPAVAAAGCVPSHAPCLAPPAGSDVDTEAEDHAPDTLRYACLARPYVVEKPQKPRNPMLRVGVGNEVTMDDLWDANEPDRDRI